MFLGTAGKHRSQSLLWWMLFSVSSQAVDLYSLLLSVHGQLKEAKCLLLVTPQHGLQLIVLFYLILSSFSMGFLSKNGLLKQGLLCSGLYYFHLAVRSYLYTQDQTLH